MINVRLLLFAIYFSATVCGCCASKVTTDSIKQSNNQAIKQSTHLSFLARMLQNDLSKLDREVKAEDAALIERYSLIRQDGGYSVAAILTLDHTYTEGELDVYDVKVQTVQGDMLTALLPTNCYLQLIESRAVKSIEINSKVQFKQ